jgi:pimeloyl-ACP methyl ester carboxylesterase
MWSPQVKALADEFRVIAPDLPGHGSMVGTRFQIESAVDSVATLIRTEAGDRALVVGLSLGGVVGIELARYYPTLVRAMVISGASVDYRQPYLRALFLINWLLLAKVYPERWLSRLQAQTFRQMLPESLAEEQIRAGFFFRGAAPAYRQLGRLDLLGDLATYPGPVLILNGENDGINRRGEGRFLATAQKGQIETIAHADHACSLTHSDAFTEAVRRFARSLS